MDLNSRELELIFESLENWISDLKRHEHDLAEELRELARKVEDMRDKGSGNNSKRSAKRGG